MAAVDWMQRIARLWSQLERRHQSVAVACAIVGTLLALATFGRDLLKPEAMDAASRENERATFARYASRLTRYCDDIFPRTIKSQLTFSKTNDSNKIDVQFNNAASFEARILHQDTVLDETEFNMDFVTLSAYMRRRSVRDFDFLRSSLAVLDRDLRHLYEQMGQTNQQGRAVVDPIFIGLYRIQETCQRDLTSLAERFATQTAK